MDFMHCDPRMLTEWLCWTRMRGGVGGDGCLAGKGYCGTKVC